jgi:hypothetical protein
MGSNLALIMQFELRKYQASYLAVIKELDELTK